MNKIEQESIRKKLVLFFSSFLKNPGNESIKNDALKLEREFMGLISYLDHSSEEIIDKELLDAIKSIGSIYQYGLFEDDHPAFSKEKIINKIKEQLKKINSD